MGGGGWGGEAERVRVTLLSVVLVAVGDAVTVAGGVGAGAGSLGDAILYAGVVQVTALTEPHDAPLQGGALTGLRAAITTVTYHEVER